MANLVKILMNVIFLCISSYAITLNTLGLKELHICNEIIKIPRGVKDINISDEIFYNNKNVMYKKLDVLLRLNHLGSLENFANQNYIKIKNEYSSWRAEYTYIYVNDIQILYIFNSLLNTKKQHIKEVFEILISSLKKSNEEFFNIDLNTAKYTFLETFSNTIKEKMLPLGLSVFFNKDERLNEIGNYMIDISTKLNYLFLTYKGGDDIYGILYAPNGDYEYIRPDFYKTLDWVDKTVIIIITIKLLSLIFKCFMYLLWYFIKNKNPYISELNHSSTKSRIIRVFFVISFILDITILGLIIGIPLFFILWAVEYIIFGSINPFYVFKKQELNTD
ncbi:Uncharacterised protein [Campylobacter hyointestinalis subsp. hyointestinalis]|uniref:Uncharacterized protein n=1 Tax=Campylobacter hyointestinalis subsp. hyointestinalis TaxID=91352 RepID=A0A9W5EUX7_CAMHY|nr:hypothetical protein [Campylobacter hyointestinalis]CUU81650.1 Uncharacterised protein [Campylobacter hyointestinalis subsp. hyointestinalis]